MFLLWLFVKLHARYCFTFYGQCLPFFVKGKLYAKQDTIRMLSKAYALHFGEPELEGEAGENNLKLLKLLLYSYM